MLDDSLRISYAAVLPVALLKSTGFAGLRSPFEPVRAARRQRQEDVFVLTSLAVPPEISL